MEKTEIKTRDEAISKAVDYQKWQSEQNLSFSELIEWEKYFTELAVKFDLVDEFKENAII